MQPINLFGLGKTTPGRWVGTVAGREGLPNLGVFWIAQGRTKEKFGSLPRDEASIVRFGFGGDLWCFGALLAIFVDQVGMNFQIQKPGSRSIECA